MTTSSWRVNQINLIYAISFMDLFAVGLTVPLFSNHLRDLGASHMTVGLFNSLYSGVQILSGPIIGSWSDVGDRKSVMMVTSIICAISYSLLGTTESLFIVVILRFVLGVVKHTQSLCKALITDLLPPQNRIGAYGQSAAFGSLGFVAGPLIGGHVSELHNGFTYVCLLTSCLFIINIGLTSQLSIPRDKNKTKATANNNRSDQQIIIKRIKAEFAQTIGDLAQIKWSTHWHSFLLRFLYALPVSMYFSNQSIYLREYFQLSQRHIGYIISLFGAVGTIVSFMLDRISERFYRDDNDCTQRLSHFFALITITFVCLYCSSNIVVFVVLLVPFAICSTMLRIVSMELMVKQSGKGHRGSFAGASNSVPSIARFVAPITLGMCGNVFGEHFTMMLSSVPSLIATVICVRMVRDNSRTKRINENTYREIY